MLLTADLRECRLGDIVVTATSHPEGLIKAEHLRPGAVIYDIAQPRNVSPDLIRERPDVLVVDGSYAKINGIELGFDMGPPPHTTFACLGETIMEALEGERSHYVGPITEENVVKTRGWAAKYGFSHAPFSSFGKPLEIEMLRKLSAK